MDLAPKKAHRLSSLDADQAELYGGPNVVMPPKYLIASTRDCVASDIDSDKSHSDEEAISSEEETSSVTTPLTPPLTNDC